MKEDIFLNDLVLLGKEFYLFLYQGNHYQFDYLLGNKKVEKKSIDNFSKNINDRIKYFSKKNIKYLHVVFPSKPLIKQKFLPDRFSDVKSLFLNYYYPNVRDLDEFLLYPIEELKSQEKEKSTFLRFDTHLSDYGKFTIVNSIAKKLGLTTISSNYLQYSQVQRSGDMMQLLRLEHKSLEDVITVKGLDTYTFTNNKSIPANTNDVVIIHNKSALTKKRVFIFGDSFFRQSLKFLKIYFTDILYIRSCFLHKDIIENFNPDIVLSGTTERYLDFVKSDKNSNNFLMQLYGNSDYKPTQSYLEALKANISFAHYPHIYKKWKENLIPMINGYVDIITDDKIIGWAKYLGNYESIELELFIDDIFVDRVKADKYRQDIQVENIHPKGLCGFEFDLKTAIPKNSKILIKGTKGQLLYNYINNKKGLK